MFKKSSFNWSTTAFALTVLLVLVSNAAAVTRNVPGEYSTIQAAIDDSNDGDEVIVAAGTYNEDISFGGKNIALSSNDVNDPAATTIQGSGTASVVIFAGSEDANCILDGFTITGGVAVDGGGINGGGASPWITNCVITDNVATGSGTGKSGGGIARSSGLITNCRIINNTSNSSGGGLAHCAGQIIDCVIADNYASESGGGLSGYDGQIIDCVITDNYAGEFGGGLYMCGGAITNCIISGNYSMNWGGGIYEFDGTIANCTIVGNRSDSVLGGLMFCNNIVNCTIVGNDGYGIAYCDGTISNCILWDNIPYSFIESSEPTYSCFPEAVSGVGNINQDPLIAMGGDYRLLAGSPCIDAGDNSAVPAGITTDLAALPRFFDDGNTPDTGNGTSLIVDIGAYEFNHQVQGQLTLWPAEIRFLQFKDGQMPEPKALSIANVGGGTISWSVLYGCSWLNVYPLAGTSSGEVNEITLQADSTGLSMGVYNCDLTIFDIADPCVSKTVEIKLIVGDTLSVPTQYSTIQAAIDAANDGDTIVVDPNRYLENIDFKGKAIIVRSTNPTDWDIINSTIIDGSNPSTYGRSSCVAFVSGEGLETSLQGFKLTGGLGTHEAPYHDFKPGDNAGGGIACYKSSPWITNCIISGNGESWSGPINGPGANPFYGGGIAIIGNCQAKVTNCIITDNVAGLHGSGIIIRSTNPNLATSVIENCTIANNKINSVEPPPAGFGSSQYEVDCWDTRATITNTIIYGNQQSGGEYPDDYYDYGRSLLIIDPNLVTYSCVKSFYLFEGDFPHYNTEPCDITVSGGNIGADPCFADLYSDDYHLLVNSPCIDSGDPNYIPEPNETDLDGNPRVINDRIDMGPYEFPLSEPTELLDILVQDVINLGLHQGIENSLLAKLNTALQKLEDGNEGNDAAAINTLQAFINVVEAQAGKKITEEDADALITAAQEIIDMLNS